MNSSELANLFKALSEPVRVRLMALLMAKGELCVCELVSALELSQSVVSRHLAYLRNNKLVTTRREGIWIYYQINAADRAIFAPLLTMIKQATENSSQLIHDLERLQTQQDCA